MYGARGIKPWQLFLGAGIVVGGAAALISAKSRSAPAMILPLTEVYRDVRITLTRDAIPDGPPAQTYRVNFLVEFGAFGESVSGTRDTAEAALAAARSKVDNRLQ